MTTSSVSDVSDLVHSPIGQVLDLTPLTRGRKKGRVPANVDLPFPVDYGSITKQRSRGEVAVEIDNANIEFLYVRGYSIAGIARHFKMSSDNVVRAVREIRDQWKANTIFDFNTAIVENLRKLDELESAAWREFEASREDFETETEKEAISGDLAKTGGGTQDTKTKRTVKRKHMANVRYLDTIEKCIEQRCRILGLYAPKEVAITQRKANTTAIEDMTNAELRQLAARQKNLDLSEDDG